MKVSVLIPYYNDREFLKETIKKFLDEKTGGRFEFHFNEYPSSCTSSPVWYSVVSFWIIP